MKFNLDPYTSVGPLRFDMSEDAVVSTVGRPLGVEKTSLGEVEYRYSGMSTRFSSTDGRLTEVAFLPEAELMVDDIDVFRDRRALEMLILKDGRPYEYVGFLIMLRLGMTLTGFHDADESQKAATVFSRGRWDQLKPQFTCYSRGR